MADKSIYHFRGVGSILLLLSDTVDLDQTPHYVASDLGLHCLPITFLGVSN